MAKFKDLTGKIFGELKVINKVENKTIHGSVIWNCLCTCGNYKEIKSKNLINGSATHCGCKSSFNDLTGQKINAWTVLEYKDYKWVCRCQCGKIGKVSTNALLKGVSKSCGCSSYFNLIGKKIGRLTILKYVEHRNNHAYVLCKCDCGNEKIIKASDLNKKNKPTQSCGCISKERTEFVKTHGLIDISGQKFGKWTVLKYNGNSNWLCRCECGTEQNIKASTLNSGNSKGCRNCLGNSLNDNFFDIIDNEEKAYILGLLYADGYNNQKGNMIKIDLQIDDEDILLKIKEAINYTGNILHYDFKVKKFNEKEYNVKPICRLNLHSKRLSEQLADKGCGQNKTYIINYPSEDKLPQNLQRHFIRGLIDGDGSISCWIDNKKTGHKKFTLTLTGTTELLNKVNEIVISKFNCKPDMRSRFKERDNNNLTLSVCGNRVIEEILDWLYEGSNIYLNRKYEKYIELKEMNKKTTYNFKNIYCMKSVLQLDKDNNIINKFKSIAEATKLGYSSSGICQACKKESHKYKNYLWFYEDDYNLQTKS